MRQLPDFSGCQILIAGDVMLDNYWQGIVNRISPEAPVPVVRVENEESRLGGAGNVAVNAASLGSHTHLLGLVGNDSIADNIEDLLRDNNVQFYLQRVSGCKTISKLRILSRNQQLLRLDCEDNFSGWNAVQFQNEFLSTLSNVNVVILSDYGKGALRDSSTLIQAANALGKPVIVDPKGSDFSRYKGATIVTPNLSEFEAVVGHCSSESDIEERGAALRDTLDLEAILITRGDKGMTLLARNKPPLHLPTSAQEVFDVTGAGDTVVAVLAVAVASGLPMVEAVKLANTAAGIVVAKLGTSTVSIQDLQSALETKIHNDNSRIINEDQLRVQMRTARLEGKRIVMTNGCFDIIHAVR